MIELLSILISFLILFSFSLFPLKIVIANNKNSYNYKSVFDDSFWIDEIIDNFSLICKVCIKSYPGKHIIDIGNNTYKWINDY